MYVSYGKCPTKKLCVFILSMNLKAKKWKPANTFYVT